MVDAEALHQLRTNDQSLESLRLLESGGDDYGRHMFEIADVANALKLNRSLRDLDLADYEFDEVEAAALAEALSSNDYLWAMSLGVGCHLTYSQLSSSACAVLIEGLKSNTSLRKLTLVGNASTYASGAQIGTSLADVLKVNRSLEFLQLENNALGDEAGVELVRALKANASLKQLRIGCNHLGRLTGLEIADALKGNVCLKELYMPGNSLGSEAGIALAEALKVNVCLQELLLAGTKMDSIVGLAFAEVLKVNSCLKELDLGGNELRDVAGVALAEALLENTSLQILSLGRCSLGNATGMALVGAVKANTCLRILTLSGNSMNEEALAALIKSLEFNVSLRWLFVKGMVDAVDGVAIRAILDASDTNILATVDIRKINDFVGETRNPTLEQRQHRNSALRKSLPDIWSSIALVITKSHIPSFRHLVNRMGTLHLGAAIFAWFLPNGAVNHFVRCQLCLNKSWDRAQ